MAGPVGYVYDPLYLEHGAPGHPENPARLQAIMAHLEESGLLARLRRVEVRDAALDGAVSSAFCLVRPPGHHATPGRAMGFCLFNNVAVAAAHALERRGLERVAIVDFDVHHGNGTQDCFYADPRVLYVSTHQYPFYPGSGHWAETGEGPA